MNQNKDANSSLPSQENKDDSRSPIIQPFSKEDEHYAKQATQSAGSPSTRVDLEEPSKLPEVPFFAELGQTSFELFNRGFNSDVIKLDINSKTPFNIDFKAGGFTGINTANTFAYLESNHLFPTYGVLLSGKWNTDKVLLTEISIPNPRNKRLKLSINYAMPQPPLPRYFQIKGEVKTDRLAWNTEAELKAIPMVKLAGVFGLNGYYAGAQAGYFLKESKFAPTQLTLSHVRDNVVVTGGIQVWELENPKRSKKIISGSIYQRVSGSIESGSEFIWNTETDETVYGVVLQYNLPLNSWLKAKIDNWSRIGFSYSQMLTNGVTLHMSILIDGKNVQLGHHKAGFGLEFNL